MENKALIAQEMAAQIRQIMVQARTNEGIVKGIDKRVRERLFDL